MTAKMKAYQIQDGSARWFVRGTTDPEEAFKVLMDEYPEAEEDVWIEEDLGFDLELVPEVEQVGWFRFSPCTCGEHGWHLDSRSGPGRGNFVGVWLSVAAVPLQFDGEEPLTDCGTVLETV